MMETKKQFWILAAGLVLMAIQATSSKNELICYQCQSQNLDECRKPEYLKACPNDQAYDRCETILEKRGRMSTTVTKKCSLAPCFLEDIKSLTQHCDQSQENYSCSWCCSENACNRAPIRIFNPVWISIVFLFRKIQ